jgi:hypothetical protein
LATNRIRGIRQAIPAGTVLARTGIGKGPPQAVKIGSLLQGSGASGAAFVRANQNMGTSLVGTTTNDDAVAGNIGEYIASTVLVGAPVPLTNNTPANITSISLTAGDWDVEGNIAFNPNAATTIALLAGWISTVSATQPTIPNGGAFFQYDLTFTTGTVQVFPTGRMRLSLASTTTVYLSVQATFAVNTLGGYGHIHARRVR